MGRILGLEFGAPVSAFRVQGNGFGVQGLGTQSLGFRVKIRWTSQRFQMNACMPRLVVVLEKNHVGRVAEVGSPGGGGGLLQTLVGLECLRVPSSGCSDEMLAISGLIVSNLHARSMPMCRP